jgi:hypothetical protein
LWGISPIWGLEIIPISPHSHVVRSLDVGGGWKGKAGSVLVGR